jgi:hypothetical protein
MANVAGPHVIHNLLLMLSEKCSYALAVRWSVQTVLPSTDISNILLDTFQQLKGRIPIELELSLNQDSYSVVALTVPRMNKWLCVSHYLNKNTVLG